MEQNNQKACISPLKMTGSGAAWVNAAAVAVATFFGTMALFGAISMFTGGRWMFDVPGIVGMFSESSVEVNGNLTGAFGVLMTALIAVSAGVIGMISLHKITNIEAMKKSWSVVSRVFVIFALLYALEAVAITIYGLMGLGRDSGVDQGRVWLSGFLPVLVKCATASVLVLIGKKIAEGKTEVLRFMTLVAIGIAGVALVLSFVSILVGFYANRSSSFGGGGSSRVPSLDSFFGL